MKDLRILSNVDMSQTLFVDNSAVNFMSSVNNGVPILPFNGNDTDDELLRLTKYLVAISQRSDMVSVNSQYFEVARYKACKSFEDAVLKLYKTVK